MFEFERKTKYLVISIKDAREALSEDELETFSAMCTKITLHRVGKDMPMIDAVVIDKISLGNRAYEEAYEIVKAAVTAKFRKECPHPSWNTDIAIMGGFDVHTCTRCGFVEVNQNSAGVVKLVYTGGLSPPDLGHAGSTPATRTKFLKT